MKICPSYRRKPGDLFKCAWQLAMALTLALTLFLGPSHVSAAAPDFGAEMAETQLLQDDHAAEHWKTL